MSERQIVIVAYKPRPGREADLLQLTREHLPILRREGMATAREAVVCQAADGTVIEVFEWEAGGMEIAHTHPAVLALWGRYAEVSTYVPLNTLDEAAQMFATFRPLAL